MERTIVYIDGFNLYNGLDEKGWRRYLWLDIAAFARALATPQQEVLAVKYFTARVGRPEGSVKRQSTFLDAIQARDPALEVVEGNCIYNEDECHGCGHTWLRREEKKTDVSIALHMVTDALGGEFDAAILVSADSDLVPVVDLIEGREGQRVVSAIPPARRCADLKRAASVQFTIQEAAFSDNQMPYFVPTPGYTVCRPADWSPDPD